MKPLVEAQRQVLATVDRNPAVRTPLWRALGLVLAEDVSAPHDVPPFANSAMDGYAVRAADVADAPVDLPVVDDVPAGHVAKRPLRPGTAIRIMTGAPLPEGADAVVKVEDTEPAGGRVRILAAAEAGTAIREAGGDVPAGSVVLGAGTRLGPPHLAVLASVGVPSPVVHRRLRVGIVSTGDEVQPPETAQLQPGWIRDTNRPLLTGLLTELGTEIHDYGIVRDDEWLVSSTLSRAAGECDVIMTSGGVSMGEYDVVKQVATELGEVEVWRVAMQPAKPLAFGLLDKTPFFGLPGNPVSVMVAFEQFARPALLTMMGASLVFRPRVQATMAETVSTDPAKTVFLRVQSMSKEQGWEARLAGGQASNVLSALAAADAFAVVPVGVGEVAAGDPVELEMFRWPASRTAQEVLGA